MNESANEGPTGAGSEVTLALGTRVEQDFVSPLTSLRGALEIMRDHPDLPVEDRSRFLNTAIQGCAHLERSVKDLARSVYEAGRKTHDRREESSESKSAGKFAERIAFDDDTETVELDLSHFSFHDSATVNTFFDEAEAAIADTGRRWYMVINYRDMTVWPEAWVAFANRGRNLDRDHALGTIHYADMSESGQEGDAQFESGDPDLLPSRQAALAKIDAMRQAR